MFKELTESESCYGTSTQGLRLN